MQTLVTTIWTNRHWCTYAPPENVELIAPMIDDSVVVLKYARKLGDAMTMDMTPESYPKRKLPVAAKTARATLNHTPILMIVVAMRLEGKEARSPAQEHIKGPASLESLEQFQRPRHKAILAHAAVHEILWPWPVAHIQAQASGGKRPFDSKRGCILKKLD